MSMALGLIGRKRGMTRVFTDEGVSIPVTVVEITANRVTQVKTVETDGYAALQVAAGERRADRVTKPIAGHYAKAGSEAGAVLREFRLEAGAVESFEVGHQLTAAMFTPGQKVDAVGISIGKGYAGVIKRHNFRRQDETHGNSLSHRAAGSIGQNQTPGRVFKGKRMAGHMGNVRRTVQNLEVVRVDEARRLLLIKGAIPGPKGGDVLIHPAVKATAAVAAPAEQEAS